MSWIKLLNETYENLEKGDEYDVRGLLPIAHSTQKAHVEVTVDTDGNFKSADFVPDVIGKEKNKSETLIPVTEKSASRSSGSAPHPLCDKLKYLAGDYKEYTGEDNTKYYTDYINQLRDWVKSEYTNQKIQAIYTYLSNQSLISDLINSNIFSVDENNRLTDKWEKCTEKLSAGNQADAFIRFRVISEDNPVSAVWQDRELQQNYIDYYLSLPKNEEFCYISGKIKNCTINHPSKIRNSGDKAKLISANDKSGFTFRGRFKTSEEAVTISYEVSQKAHNALKYLIQKQGEKIGDKVFLLWGTKDENTPDLNADSLDIMSGGEEDLSEYSDTRDDCAKKFNHAIEGYKADIDFYTKLAVIGLDSATTGRMSIIYYREYLGVQANDLIDNIKNWHETCSWYHRYKFKDKKLHPFFGAPSPNDIAKCAYGTEQGNFIDCDDKILANAVERILPCITDGAKIPRDIVHALVRKSFSPKNYKNINNWRKVLSITCSCYRKYLYDYNEREVITMEIQNTNDISYNLGRLLAVADAIESYALRNASGDKKSDIRVTNAMRYFNRFTRMPCKTWGVINNKLSNYKNKLGGKGKYLYELLGEISTLISPDEFSSVRNLDGRIALGFDSQKKAIIDRSIALAEAKKNKEEK